MPSSPVTVSARICQQWQVPPWSTNICVTQEEECSSRRLVNCFIKTGISKLRKKTDQLERELTGILDEDRQPITKFLKTAVEP
jgi:hypothetical protein